MPLLKLSSTNFPIASMRPWGVGSFRYFSACLISIRYFMAPAPSESGRCRCLHRYDDRPTAKSTRGLMLRVHGAPEVEHVAIHVLDLEADQVVAVHAQRLPERHAARGKLRRERLGVRNRDVGIPARPLMPAGVGLRLHLGRNDLEEDPHA